MGYISAAQYAYRSGRLRSNTLAAVLAAAIALGGLAPAFGEVRNPNGVAVIIGNKEYEDELIPDVSFADRDAAAFRQYVLEVLGYAPEKVIEIPNADRRTMERIFGTESGHERRLWSELNPDGGSEVVVFYSGHGVPGLAGGEEQPRGYLLPTDARPEDATRDGYPIDLLYENLGKLWEADSIVVYLDACFSGVSDGGKLLPDASPVYVEAELPAGDKVTVVTASTAKEVASWDRENQHGLFTHHLLDALYGRGDRDGDGVVTADELRNYLDRYMTRAARRIFDRSQHATVLGPVGVTLARAIQGVFPARPELGAEPGSAVPGADARRAAPGRDQVPRDLLLLGMREASEAGEHEKVVEYAGKLEELSGELPAAARYYRAQAYVALGKDEEAIEELTAYLEEVGREGENYEAALQELLRVSERLEEEAAVYEVARRSGTAAAYGEYLRKYPNGRHAEEARRQQGEAEDREDSTAYRRAAAQGTAAGYADYLRQYPGGLHARDARAARAEAQRREDDAAYELARRVNTAAGYAEYLRKYPTGRHAAAAKRMREQKDQRPGTVFRDCEQCPEMVVAPAGSYLMGSPTTEAGRSGDEEPQHWVTIGERFAVGVYEVTRDEFREFTDDTGHNVGASCRRATGDIVGKGWRDPGYQQSDRHPVVCVNWHDVQAYVRWLTRKTGEEYRLLSESEWEYVARGGTSTARYWGEGSTGPCRNANLADRQSRVGWAESCDDGYARTAPVGTYTRNRYGLYDVLGNVREWVEDCWNDRYAGAPSDGTAWDRGRCASRVVRGGSWRHSPRGLRSADRGWTWTEYRINNIGFRVARTLRS